MNENDRRYSPDLGQTQTGVAVKSIKGVKFLSFVVVDKYLCVGSPIGLKGH